MTTKTKVCSVHMVVVDLGNRNSLKETLESLHKAFLVGKGSGGPYELSHSLVHVSPGEPGGTFSAVAASWMKSGADFIGYMSSACVVPEDRFVLQLTKMINEKLSASYGDTEDVDKAGNKFSVELYKDFSPEMIGVDCLDTETMLFNTAAFRRAGGFDYIVAGAYNPPLYLTTMAACAGRVAHVPSILIKRRLGHPRRWARGGVLAYEGDDTKDFWYRLDLEKFARQAREQYETSLD